MMSRYTHAIVSRIPNNIQLDSQISKNSANFDLQKARKEQEDFCEVLRDAGVDVIELSPEENAPASSIFLEDLAVVCNGTALVAAPNRPTRRKEITALLNELGLHVVELEQPLQTSGKKSNNPKAMVEGSDVLFTGREFFVGITKYTNLAGAMEVANTFPEYPVTPVKVNSDHHLKAYISLAAPGVLAVSSSLKESQDILKRIEREATFRYQILTIPLVQMGSEVSSHAVCCLNVNGTLIFRGEWPAVTEEQPIFLRHGQKLGESVCHALNLYAFEHVQRDGFGLEKFLQKISRKHALKKIGSNFNPMYWNIFPTAFAEVMLSYVVSHERDGGRTAPTEGIRAAWLSFGNQMMEVMQSAYLATARKTKGIILKLRDTFN